MGDLVKVDIEGGIHRITLNRPEVMNALNRDLRRNLTAALVAGHSARVIVLTGAGRGFCSGQDLSDAGGLDEAGFEAVLNGEYVPMIRAITEAPVPVIAAVNGVAAGAGANLALACDLVIAAESAVFIQAFTRIGLIPDAGGTSFLPRRKLGYDLGSRAGRPVRLGRVGAGDKARGGPDRGLCRAEAGDARGL
jgi:2-(1,2-epoxy-1,2-dihydrophenyl)acetyl-CoA isomerase